MDVVNLIHIPLFNDSQSPLSSVPFSPLLPPNEYPDGHANKYFDNNIDYLDNKLNSDTIKAF